jgi:hypothetical protein
VLVVGSVVFASGASTDAVAAARIAQLAAGACRARAQPGRNL